MGESFLIEGNIKSIKKVSDMDSSKEDSAKSSKEIIINDGENTTSEREKELPNIENSLYLTIKNLNERIIKLENALEMAHKYITGNSLNLINQAYSNKEKVNNIKQKNRKRIKKYKKKANEVCKTEVTIKKGSKLYVENKKQNVSKKDN